ncbi:MAG TPA: multicopper oxidase family protein [Gemmatimonadaceae bacterium]|nr:multicopper oxidase family protein [Gemmatimonadaceae bacterium]
MQQQKESLTVASLVKGGGIAEPPRFVDMSAAPNIVEVTLIAAPASLTLLPGRITTMYSYNGSSPGPTLELREGDRVIVHFRNELPVETTVHWHGLHIPFDQDGSPFHPVAPGATHTYDFTLRPGSAGTYWYHPHPHHHTGYQVGMGLYGAIVVRAADDPLPATLQERVLLLSDNRFTADGALDFPERNSHAGRVDEENGREGDVIFVSGSVLPTLGIRSGEVQRWRVINASAARMYRLSLEGHTLLHVGSDGGLFEHPVETDEIILGNGERAEFLVRASAKPGTRARFQALPYNRYIPQTRPYDWDKPRDILTLEYTQEASLRPVALPARLRPIPALDTAAVTVRRVMALSQHLINGLSMDMNRVDASARLGATEIWEVENLVGMDHPFHLHGFQFQLLDRNGVPEKQRKWKDTVNVPKHQTARFIVRFDNYPGKWMFHCHILDHEDAGMMGVLEVK